MKDTTFWLFKLIYSTTELKLRLIYLYFSFSFIQMSLINKRKNKNLQKSLKKNFLKKKYL